MNKVFVSLNKTRCSACVSVSNRSTKNVTVHLETPGVWAATAPPFYGSKKHHWQQNDCARLGTESQWLPQQMQPFLPPEHTTSALKVAVRHSRHLISVSRQQRAIERKERERWEWCTSICLTHCLSTSSCLSFCVALALSGTLAL